jgi:hypothetical protein
MILLVRVVAGVLLLAHSLVHLLQLDPKPQATPHAIWAKCTLQRLSIMPAPGCWHHPQSAVVATYAPAPHRRFSGTSSNSYRGRIRYPH